MQEVPEKIDFPKMEEDVLQHWNDVHAFEESVRLSEGKPEYSFYDGPPFATGLPHYGHILAGTIKDVVTRYAHQNGHHVVRRFGWDTHGLPIEFEIDKKLGVKTKEDVLAMGIPKYNAECRNIVMTYAGQWKTIVQRLGRWIDMDNAYKTLDLSYMESIWWVFKQIFEKGMVYRGFKVMPYSTGCTTPLSNFEANLNYKDVDDPAVIVSFPLIDEPDVALLAWTTTPWTLPSNIALCVNAGLDYVKAQDEKTGAKYIVAEARLAEVWKPQKGKPAGYKVLEKFKGVALKGKAYKPLFPYFYDRFKDTAFRIACDDYVSSESGTGVVHQAPGFGEDDYRVCITSGFVQKQEIPCPIDDNGRFLEPVADFLGQYVKDADKPICKALKDAGRLFSQGTLNHSYPFCWRSETPLIYRAVPSWFIKVEEIRDRLLANNKATYWVPDFVQEKRFANWLADAHDWAVSRNRYWGTPLPVWISEDLEEVICVGSVAELEKLSGVKVHDLHRESVDHITIPSQKGKGTLRRIEEVFDCWFESGSMPYAQLHYPFENEELFNNSFPADFIAEGIDQTRGWFYTLLVISTILFDKPPFKNLIVNGLVLAADGKKMSKRLKNYPDPMEVVNSYGADALRLYLINSPVVRAEALKFSEPGVRSVVKDVFLPWYNAYRFFADNARAQEGFVPSVEQALKSPNVLDNWILTATNSLIRFVREEMAAYRLYTVVPRLVQFIDQLTNWYVRLNRRRFKLAAGREESATALSVLFEVLFVMARAMAPFTPFLTEYMYQNLRNLLPEKQDSLHYLMFPTPRDTSDPDMEANVALMQVVIELGRAARDRRKTPLKTPLTEVCVIHPSKLVLEKLDTLNAYIKSELNVKNVVLSTQGNINLIAKPNWQVLGRKLKGDIDKVRNALKALSHDQLAEFQKSGEIVLEGHQLTTNDVQITREFAGDKERYEASWNDNVLVILNLEINAELEQEGQARELINRVQRLRKTSGLRPHDLFEAFVEPVDEQLEKVLRERAEFIASTLGTKILPASRRQPFAVAIGSDGGKRKGVEDKLTVTITRRAFSFAPSVSTSVALAVATMDYEPTLKRLTETGSLALTVNSAKVTLQNGKDIFPSATF